MSAFHLQLSPAVAAAVSQTFPSPSAPAVSWLSPACSDNGIMLLFSLRAYSVSCCVPKSDNTDVSKTSQVHFEHLYLGGPVKIWIKCVEWKEKQHAPKVPGQTKNYGCYNDMVSVLDIWATSTPHLSKLYLSLFSYQCDFLLWTIMLSGKCKMDEKSDCRKRIYA